RIDSNIEAAAAAVVQVDVELYAKLNTEFHILLYDTPSSQWSLKIFTNLGAQTTVQHGFGAVPERMAVSLAEHQMIVSAIRRQDFSAAADLIRRHEAAAGEALVRELVAQR